MPLKHEAKCAVWLGREVDDGPDVTQPCTCGLRSRQSTEVTSDTTARPARLTDDEFLHTLGINPETH